MIDRERRNKAISVLRQVVQGELDADKFTEVYPEYGLIQNAETRDAAISPIFFAVYTQLSGRRPQRHPSEQQLVNRCIQFLQTDLEYEWKSRFYANVGRSNKMGEWLTFGILSRINAHTARNDKQHFENLRADGDVEVYPFIRQHDFESAQNFV